VPGTGGVIALHAALGANRSRCTGPVKPSPIRAFDDHRIGTGRAHRSVHQHRLEHGAGIGVQVNLGDRIATSPAAGVCSGCIAATSSPWSQVPRGGNGPMPTGAPAPAGGCSKTVISWSRRVLAAATGGRGVVRGVHRVADWAQLGRGVDADRGHRQDAAPGRG